MGGEPGHPFSGATTTHPPGQRGGVWGHLSVLSPQQLREASLVSHVPRSLPPLPCCGNFVVILVVFCTLHCVLTAVLAGVGSYSFYSDGWT